MSLNCRESDRGNRFTLSIHIGAEVSKKGAPDLKFLSKPFIVKQNHEYFRSNIRTHSIQ